jgi:RHS repeat-associated protein
MAKYKLHNQSGEDFSEGTDCFQEGWEVPAGDYDPLVARFLSPDPFIQAPTYSQSFNRYSYVMNDPINLVDRSGYYWEGYDEDDPENLMWSPIPQDENWFQQLGNVLSVAWKEIGNIWNDRNDFDESTDFLYTEMVDNSGYYFLDDQFEYYDDYARSEGGGNEEYFPNALYSRDANKGDVYVSNNDIISIFSQSVQPVAGTVTIWGVAIYEIVAGSASIIPNVASAPVLMLQISLQIEDWKRNAILRDYNANGGGQGMIMNYRESIQDWNGYLHVDRSMTLIDAINGGNYGTFNQNYLPRK